MAIRGLHINASRESSEARFLISPARCRRLPGWANRLVAVVGVLDRTTCYVVTLLQRMGPPGAWKPAVYREAVHLQRLSYNESKRSG